MMGGTAGSHVGAETAGGCAASCCCSSWQHAAMCEVRRGGCCHTGAEMKGVLSRRWPRHVSSNNRFSSLVWKGRNQRSLLHSRGGGGAS